MRLDKLYIAKFKNLIDITIDFDETSLTTVLVGKNATGKSNLIEALVLIFRNLDLGKKPEFKYQLDYLCRNRRIHIDADPERQKKYQIRVDERSISLASFVKDPGRQYLPNNVFGYYSGPSTRLEQHFDEHQERFYHQLLSGEKAPLRPLFYARAVHSQYVLLAFFSFEKEVPPFLKNYLGITSFENAKFVIKQPNWYKKSKDSGDTFWGARGVVREFLERLYSLGGRPKKEIRRVRLPWVMGFGRKKTEEQYDLNIADWASLRELARPYRSNVEFFKTLESMYISDLISELKIEVKKEGLEVNVPFSELSDGERQLLTVLGLLRFTKEEESLFLLDEPDTHLNPAWKLEYMDLVQDVVGRNESSHILIVTHDPLMIGGLTRHQVQLFSLNRDKRVTVAPPDEDPIGMGVAGLLTSDMFELPTTLDKVTQQKLNRKRELVTKEERTTDEDLELAKLNDELEQMGFITDFRDTLYTQFQRALKDYEVFKRPALTKQQRKEQAEVAKEIIGKLEAEATRST